MIETKVLRVWQASGGADGLVRDSGSSLHKYENLSQATERCTKPRTRPSAPPVSHPSLSNRHAQVSETGMRPYERRAAKKRAFPGKRKGVPYGPDHRRDPTGRRRAVSRGARRWFPLPLPGRSDFFGFSYSCCGWNGLVSSVSNAALTVENAYGIIGRETGTICCHRQRFRGNAEADRPMSES